MARLKRDLFDGGGLKVNMSPMIDLVFILLFFFMISSTLITYQKDPNVQIPVASFAQVPKLVQSRVIINVYEDGTVKDESARRVLTPELIEDLMAEEKARNPKVRLHLRADRRVTHRMVKEVIAASARGGVSDVIFSTFVTDR